MILDIRSMKPALYKSSLTELMVTAPPTVTVAAAVSIECVENWPRSIARPFWSCPRVVV